MIKNNSLVFSVQGLLVSALVLFAANCFAAKIYKWVDEDGKTHYSATAPIHQESISMGNTNKNKTTSQAHDRPDDGSCDKASKAELLVGVWQLIKQPTLHFRFYDRWHLSGKNNKSIQKYSFDIASGKLQTGVWSVTNDILKLKIETLNENQTYFKTIRKARIHKINKFDLYLLINDTNAMKFERDTNSEFKPKCMDQNHHDDKADTKKENSEKNKTSINQPVNKPGNISH